MRKRWGHVPMGPAMSPLTFLENESCHDGLQLSSDDPPLYKINATVRVVVPWKLLAKAAVFERQPMNAAISQHRIRSAPATGPNAPKRAAALQCDHLPGRAVRPEEWWPRMSQCHVLRSSKGLGIHLSAIGTTGNITI